MDPVKAHVPILTLTLALIATNAPLAAGDAWTCTNGKLERSVTLYYPQAPASVPCRVYYGKRNENVIPRVIWSAEHDAGYCEVKAAAFVARLQSLGWSCIAEGEPTEGATESR